MKTSSLALPNFVKVIQLIALVVSPTLAAGQTFSVHQGSASAAGYETANLGDFRSQTCSFVANSSGGGEWTSCDGSSNEWGVDTSSSFSFRGESASGSTSVDFGTISVAGVASSPSLPSATLLTYGWGWFEDAVFVSAPGYSDTKALIFFNYDFRVDSRSDSYVNAQIKFGNGMISSASVGTGTSAFFVNLNSWNGIGAELVLQCYLSISGECRQQGDLRFTGIKEVALLDGTEIHDFTTWSASGFDYTRGAMPIPEPGTYALFGAGLTVIALGVRRRRRYPA